MKDIKSVAVIMSVYKSDNSNYLKLAIESVLNQTVECDLLIYQDGDIPSDLSDVLEFYLISGDIKLFVERQNKGLAHAMNFLITKSLQNRYDFIARMDSDDIARPSRIEMQVAFFNDNPEIEVLGTSCSEFGASFALSEKHLPKSHSELLKFSVVRCPFIHPSVMFRISVFLKGHRYPENTTLTEDMALWFQLLNDDIKFSNLNEVLLDYRVDENTINRRKGFHKALSEFTIRFHNMLKLRQLSLKNIVLITSRLVFHLMPNKLLKLAYKKLR
jgi:hypothetical protein